MAVITTATLIVLGVATAIGAAGTIWHACTEEDRAKEKIKQLEAENEQLNLAKNYVNDIKTKLISAKEYLTDARNDFKNGGHVSDNQPLAFVEFNGCINTLEGAIENSTNLINDFDATIEENEKQILVEEAKINNYSSTTASNNETTNVSESSVNNSTNNSSLKTNNTNSTSNKTYDAQRARMDAMEKRLNLR